ncbi:MAG: HAMP domain-containing protein, partial [Pseudomonadota bacterium]
HLGLSSKPLDEVAGLTRWLMVLLGVITVAAVAGVSYLFGRLLSRPMRTLSTAMASVGDGDLDYRIAHGRSDEFGQLFDRFNAMATKLGKPAAAPFQDGFDDLIGEVDPSFGERDTDSSALENIVEDGSSPPDETMEQLTEPEPDAGQDPPKKLPPADEVDSEGLEAEPAAQENLDATIVAVRQPPVTSDSAAPTQEPSGASLEDEKPHPDEITEPNTAPVAEHSHNPVETDGVAEGDEIAGDDRTMIVSPRRIKFSPKTKGAPKNNEGEPTDPKESTA